MERGGTVSRLMGVLESCPESYDLESACLCTKVVLDTFSQKTDDDKYDAGVLLFLLKIVFSIKGVEVGELRKGIVHSLLMDDDIRDYERYLFALRRMRDGSIEVQEDCDPLRVRMKKLRHYLSRVQMMRWGKG